MSCYFKKCSPLISPAVTGELVIDLEDKLKVSFYDIYSRKPKE